MNTVKNWDRKIEIAEVAAKKATLFGGSSKPPSSSAALVKGPPLQRPSQGPTLEATAQRLKSDKSASKDAPSSQRAARGRPGATLTAGTPAAAEPGDKAKNASSEPKKSRRSIRPKRSKAGATTAGASSAGASSDASRQPPANAAEVAHTPRS